MTEMMTMTGVLEEGAERRLTVADYEARIHLYKEQIGLGYIGIGRTLNEAKAAGVVPDGQWEAWMTEITGLTVRQAQRCMQAAREIRDGSVLARLEMSKAMRLLSSGLGEDEREALAEKAIQDEMTVKELEAEIRKLKTGFDQAVDQAKQWESRAREAFAEGQKSAERAQNVEENLRAVEIEERARKKVALIEEGRQAAISKLSEMKSQYNELQLQADALRQQVHEQEQRAKQAEEQLKRRQGADQEQYRIGMEAGTEIGVKRMQQEVDQLRQKINEQRKMYTERLQELQQLKAERRQQQMAEARGTSPAEPAGTWWISVSDRLPENDVNVLAVKELKSGQREICLAKCIREFEYYDVESGEKRKKPYWVCGGNNNILYWMALPGMPAR